MFEAELERVRKQLKQQIASAQPYVSIVELLSDAQVHPAISAFFRAEVEWWVHEERALRTSNPRFATTDPAFADVFRRLDTLYVQHARFDHEELTTTIDAAAKTWLNYLCRPRVTLRWFVFRGEPTKPLHEILLRLQYLTEYEYLLDGFRQWASTRSSDASGFEILSVIEFERIVEKIDNDAILDMSQSQFVALLDPLFAFFAAYDPDMPPESVPTEAVIIFLDDKGAVPISQALERMLYREEMRTLTRTKLIEVIDGVLASLEVDEQHASASPEIAQQNVTPIILHETVSVPSQPTVQATVDVVDVATPAGEVVVRDVQPEEEKSIDHVPANGEESTTQTNVSAAEPIVAEPIVAEPVVAEPIVAEPVVAEPIVAEPVVAEPIVAEPIVAEPVVADAPHQEASDEMDSAASQDDVLEDVPAEHSVADTVSPDEEALRRHERSTRLVDLVDEKLRDRVIKRMLGRSQERYDEIIDLVLACDSWKAAAGALDRYYAQHGIEPNSAAAIEFSQAVYRSFSGITP